MPVAERLLESRRDFLRFLERRLGDRALAEDILQDAFVKSVEREDELREEEAAVAWFYRVLRNAVIDHYRRTATRNRALEALAKEMESASAPPPEWRSAICACVARLAENLQPAYATALRRVEVDEVPVNAFAQEEGITANNAAVRVHRAREALRKEVRAACGACATHGCVECDCAG